VPVSLGILLDASGSMNTERLTSAKAAITHLVFDLLDKEDELFFVEFGYSARLTQGWTTDRTLIRHALGG
jgi:Mg-chelatase subunit ChlD